MARWEFSFIADGKHFEHLMEMLVPLKVEDLNFKVVAGTPTKIRAGDKPAWQIVTDMATEKPRPRVEFVVALKKAGFNNGAGIQQAVAKRTVRKVNVKGAAHLALAKGGK